MKTKLCILTVIIFFGTPIAFAGSYTLNPVDVSLPTVGDSADGISQIGVEQAWFAFELSSIPDAEDIVSATFSAYMRDFDAPASQRTLWYDSDDTWIKPKPNTSDPDYPNISAADNIVGTVTFGDQAYTWITIDITHDWTSDLVDDYITLMLTGTTGNASGAVGLQTYTKDGIPADPELTLITIPAPGAILLGGLGVGIVGWMRKRKTL